MSDNSSTRDFIIAVTADLINEGGESAVRLNVVAARTGIREPSLYHHFANREELITEAQIKRYRRGFDELLQRFVEVSRSVESEQEFYRLVEGTLEAIFDPARSSIRQMRINVIGSALQRPKLLEIIASEQREINETLVSALHLAQLRGWIHSDLDLHAASAWIFGLIIGRIQIEIGNSRVNPDSWNRIAIDAVLSTLRGSLK
jgi:AcrR family transcriptional regulator